MTRRLGLAGLAACAVIAACGGVTTVTDGSADTTASGDGLDTRFTDSVETNVADVPATDGADTTPPLDVPIPDVMDAVDATPPVDVPIADAMDATTPLDVPIPDVMDAVDATPPMDVPTVDIVDVPLPMDVAVMPPRPIAPLSTATTTSNRPTLRWALAAGSDGAAIDLCRDGAFTTGCASFTVTGSSGRPSAALAAGLWFWRLHGTASGATGSTTGPIWEFVVTAHPAASVDTSWGQFPDVNGDGFADVVVSPNGPNHYVYLGTGTGPAPAPSVTIPSVQGYASTIGDINGDGYTDLAIVGTPITGTIAIYHGTATGPHPTATVLLSPPSGATGCDLWAIGLGDVDGDGYGDVARGCQNGSAPVSYVYFGSASGLASGAPVPIGGGVPGPAGDVNGDGFADILIGTIDIELYLGSSSGFSTSAVTLPGVSSWATGSFTYDGYPFGDLNGDGYADVLGFNSSGLVYFGGPGAGLSAARYINVGAGSPERGADINGDGLADFLYRQNIGGITYNTWYQGTPTGPSATGIHFTAPSGHSILNMVPAGDIDHDGYIDLIGRSDTMQVFIWTGAASGPTAYSTYMLMGSDFSYGVF